MTIINDLTCQGWKFDIDGITYGHVMPVGGELGGRKKRLTDKELERLAEEDFKKTISAGLARTTKGET